VKRFVIASILAVLAMGFTIPAFAGDDTTAEVSVSSDLKNNLSQEILTRLDVLAQTVGTTVGELFAALRGDAMRLGAIHIAMWGFIALVLFVMSIILIKQFMVGFRDEPMSDKDIGKQVVLGVLGLVCIGCMIACVCNMVKGIQYIGAPTTYAVDQLKGIFGV